MKRGILLLGHGSRRSTANLGLVTLAELVQAGLGMRVLPAYFQFERPNLADTVEQFVNEGVTEIVVVPALLFPGVHLKEDIPAALGELEARYGERVRLILTEGFAPDPRLAEIVMERVHATVAGMTEDGALEREGVEQDGLTNPEQITSRSRSLIESSLGLRYLEQFPPREGEIVRRVVHAMGNPDAAHLLRFHPAAVEAGLAAIRAGATLFTDVRMVKMGINRAVLRGNGRPRGLYDPSPAHHRPRQGAGPDPVDDGGAGVSPAFNRRCGGDRQCPHRPGRGAPAERGRFPAGPDRGHAGGVCGRRRSQGPAGRPGCALHHHDRKPGRQHRGGVRRQCLAGPGRRPARTVTEFRSGRGDHLVSSCFSPFQDLARG